MLKFTLYNTFIIIVMMIIIMIMVIISFDILVVMTFVGQFYALLQVTCCAAALDRCLLFVAGSSGNISVFNMTHNVAKVCFTSYTCLFHLAVIIKQWQCRHE